MGRPLREGGPRRVRTYRVDDAEYALIRAAAAAKDTTTTEWVREVLVRAARRTKR